MKQSVLSIILLLFHFSHPICASEVDTIASGYCGGEGDGTNLTWVFTSDYVLTVYGRGEMYTTYSAPWDSLKPRIKHLVLSDSITSIGYDAFSGCNGLRGQPHLPDSLRTIGGSAFLNCGGISGQLLIPDSVSEIGASAFQNCISLSGSLIIPNAVKTLGYAAFENCNRLNGTLTLSESLTEISASAFYKCSFTGDLIIPEGVTNIYGAAFRDCKFNGELVLPKGLVSIAYFAFIEGPDFSRIVINSTNPPIIEDDSFSATEGKIAFVPKGTIDEYQSVWGDLGLLFVDTQVELTIHVATPGSLFQEIRNEGYVPAQVTKLTLTGRLNDADWSVLKDQMTILCSLDLSGIDNTTMPEFAFQSNKTLTEFVFPEKLTVVPNGIFSFSVLSGELKLPQGITHIGAEAFNYCYRLSGNLIVPNGVKSMGEGAFRQCSGLLGEVVLPNSLVQLRDDDFYVNCQFEGSGINAIVFGNNITFIPYDIVRGCKIDSITCLSVVPPTIEKDFENVDTRRCKLKVPTGTKKAYMAAPIWCNFYNIVEVDMPEDTYLVKVYTVNGMIADVYDNQLTATTVTKDSVLTLQIIPDEGYEFTKLLIDGKDMTDSVMTDGWFSTPAIDSTMNIIAEFTQLQYRVDIYTVGSGTVLTHYIPYGGDYTVNINADDGHKLHSVRVLGVEQLCNLGDNGRMLLSDIRQNITIVVDATDSEIPNSYVAPNTDSDITLWTADGKIFVSADEVIAGIELLDLNGRIVSIAAPHTTVSSVTAPNRHTAYIVKVRLTDSTEQVEKVVVD